MYERGIGVSIDMASAATYYRTCLNNEIVGANAAYALASLQHSGKCPGARRKHKPCSSWPQMHGTLSNPRTHIYSLTPSLSMNEGLVLFRIMDVPPSSTEVVLQIQSMVQARLTLWLK